jgi:hypothetical protein
VTKKRAVRSIDDPVLKRLRIGVPLVGDDGTNPPPVHALSRRGIIDNVFGFTVYGDYSKPNPPLAVLDALDDGAIDVAIVWGPLAGFRAKRTKLRVTPIPPADADLPFSFEIGMGVRHDDRALKERLDRIIETRRREIERILDAFGVPRS